MEELEISQLDVSLKRLRMRDQRREKALLCSVQAQGIREPLLGVQKADGNFMVLDGFKRYRCAQQLEIRTVPVNELSNDEAVGMLEMLRRINMNKLHLLEQAALVEMLCKEFGMGVVEISRYLECSHSWVSIRQGLVGEMSEVVRSEIFSGRFPARSYLYCLRHVTRVTGVKNQEVEEFVKCVSGQQLSTRQIELLANVYFHGSSQMREQLQAGNLGWTLDQLRSKPGQKPVDHRGQMLQDLKRSRELLRKVAGELQKYEQPNQEFLDLLQKWLRTLGREFDIFKKILEKFDA